MQAKEMFEKLGFELVKEISNTNFSNTLIYLKNDGGYMTQYLFNGIMKELKISERETYNNNKPQGNTTIDKELLNAITKQIEELGWL